MPFSKLTPKQKQTLLETARHAIQYGLTYHRYPRLELNNYPEPLTLDGASFVTLTETGKLRGCMGTLEPYQPLVQDVAEHAYAAAFKDPRFPPVNPLEEPMLHICVSILSEPEIITCKDEAELLQQLVVNEDGLILEFAGHRATFLPEVWQQLPQPEKFLRQLKLKAGLSEDFWDPQMTFKRYRTIVID